MGEKLECEDEKKINLKVQVLLFYSSKCANKHILHINEMIKQKAHKSTRSSVFAFIGLTTCDE